MTEEQVDEAYNTLAKEPKYPNNASAELWDINRKQVEHLISNRIMTGYVAHYNSEIYAYCNCGNKNKYAGLPPELRELKTEPDGAKVLSIMEIMVSNTYKNCGLEELLITETLKKSKMAGYTHAEIYPFDNRLITEEEFEAETRINRQLVELLKNSYGNHSLEQFGKSTYEGDYASIFFEYWRSFLAVKQIVEDYKGDIKAVFASYHKWNEECNGQTLLEWFDVEI